MASEFNLDTKESKAITNPECVGLAGGVTDIDHYSPPLKTFSISVKEGAVHNGDVEKTFCGPLSGGGGSTFNNHNEDSHGFHTPTGNKIQINGQAGAETIEIVHHTGASIILDVDGAIFIQPTGLKGFGLNSEKGDGVIAAGQRIVIKGNSGITIETDGDLDLNIGGSMHVDVGGDYVLNVDGATTISTDGTTTIESTKDYLETIGGVRRSTVAGDYRQQAVGETRFDSGKTFEARSDSNVKLYSQDTMELLSKNSTSLEVDTGNLQVLSKGDITVGSTSGGMYLTAGDNISIDAASAVSSRSNGNFILSTKGTMFLDADSAMDLRGRTTSITGFAGMNIFSANLDINSTGHMNLHSSSALAITSKQNVDIRGDTAAALQSSAVCSVIGQTTYLDGTTSIQIRSNDIESKVPVVVGATSPNSPQGAIAAATPPSIEVADIRTPPTILSPKKAEYPDAKTIISSMTTEVDAPDFPHNAKRMNAQQFSRYENENGSPNPKAKAAAYPNQGAGSPATMGDSMGTISEPKNFNYDGSNNKSMGEKNPFPLPASISNANDKLSNLVTVGMLPGLMRCGATNNGLTRQQILENAAHLSYNVIDPILRQFGAKIKITDYLRIGSGGSRHYSGKAVDMASCARNFAETAEAAAWVRDNVAFDRLFLEANNAGTVHMHIEAAPPGQKGARTVWTCSDPKCQGRKDGLELAFAVQGLKRMGFA